MIVSMKINNSTIKKKKVKIQLTTTAIYLYLVSDGVVFTLSQGKCTNLIS